MGLDGPLVSKIIFRSPSNRSSEMIAVHDRNTWCKDFK